MALLRAFCGIVLLLSTPFDAYAWSCSSSSSSNNKGPIVSRRAFIFSQAVAVSTFGTWREVAVAIEDTNTSGTRPNNEKRGGDDDNNDDERERKRREKEAERIAKETKQRLAAGRIGRI